MIEENNTTNDEYVERLLGQLYDKDDVSDARSDSDLNKVHSGYFYVTAVKGIYNAKRDEGIRGPQAYEKTLFIDVETDGPAYNSFEEYLPISRLIFKGECTLLKGDRIVAEYVDYDSLKIPESDLYMMGNHLLRDGQIAKAYSIMIMDSTDLDGALRQDFSRDCPERVIGRYDTKA